MTLSETAVKQIPKYLLQGPMYVDSKSCSGKLRRPCVLCCMCDVCLRINARALEQRLSGHTYLVPCNAGKGRRRRLECRSPC